VKTQRRDQPHQESRQIRRQRAREERHAQERAARAAAEKRRRKLRLAVAALVATVIVAALVVVNEVSQEPERRGPAPAGETSERAFAGIPQDGWTLGRKDAPVTVVEFVDMQCPFCGQFATTQLDGVVDKYVRSGKVKLELRTLAFIGPDSITAAQAVQAAAEQNLAWDFTHAFFARQGMENSGYVTGDFIDEVSAAVPGLDAGAVRGAGDGQGIALAEREAGAAQVESTPTFLVNGKKATMDELDATIDAAL
jgi:protein-disulfide isomerase